MACSTTPMSTRLTESRRRASHSISGTCAEMASASRTSSSAYRGAVSKQLTPTTYGSRRLSKKSIGAKLSVTRRVSTSTTAPSAPRISSSHMNQNRVCPGVPNRYRMRSWLMVMRPKSMATVVVALPGPLAGSSTPTPAAVITASVVSGVISETAPTSVVLPTPNPPATTIFADLIVEGVSRAPLEVAESTEHPFQQFHAVVAVVRVGGVVQREQPVRHHVRDQYPGYAERQPGVGGDLRQRLRPPVAQRGDHLLVPAGEPSFLLPPRRRYQYRLDGDVALGLGTATGDRVRPDQCATRVVTGPLHDLLTPLPNLPAAQPACDTLCRADGVSAWPTRSTSSAISYPTWPTSQVRLASTARHEPSLMDIRKRYPPSISMIVWRTAPPLKYRAVPCVRLTTPAAIAASWSARSSGNAREAASSRPSADTATTCAIPATWSAKLFNSHPMSRMVPGLVIDASPRGPAADRGTIPRRLNGRAARPGGRRTAARVRHRGCALRGPSCCARPPHRGRAGRPGPAWGARTGSYRHPAARRRRPRPASRGPRRCASSPPAARCPARATAVPVAAARPPERTAAFPPPPP